MRRRNRNPVRAGLGLWVFLSSAALAQPNPLDFVERVEVHLVEVDVVVTDRKGRPVAGLDQDDFILLVDGQPAEIVSFIAGPSGKPDPSRRPATDDRIGPAERASAPSPTEPTETSSAMPLTVVLYLDELNIHPAHRGRLLHRLDAALEPWRATGAQFMLATFADRLAVVVPPTTDLDTVLEAASRPSVVPARAARNANRRRRALTELSEMAPGGSTGADFSNAPGDAAARGERGLGGCGQQLWHGLLATARNYAGEAETQAVIAVEALTELASVLGGIEGRKAVVHLSDGLVQRPGLSAFQYVVEQACPDDVKHHPEAYSEMAQRDLASRLHALAAMANANRLTLYPLDAGGIGSGLHQDLSFGEPGLVPSMQNDSTHSMNAQNGLYILARETGGKLLRNSNDAAELLDDARRHAVAAYSLGFVPGERRPGQVRRIDVVLDSDVGRGRAVDHRRSFRDKSLDERLAERLFAVAHLGANRNQLAARLDFHGTTEIASNVFQLTVGVSIPADSVTKVAAADGKSGRLRVWLLAIDHLRQAHTTVRQKLVTVGGPNGIAAQGGEYRLRVAMDLEAGEYDVAAGLRDETTGFMALLRERVVVPPPG